MREISSTVRWDIPEFTSTIGSLCPSAEVVIRSSASHPVSVDEPGELCVRGPQVMRGYWNRPQLPEANIGKVMRRCLRAELAETSPINPPPVGCP
jgi:acyl-CoA synthetase (AMP-forming)/AMP-acid ligase II